MRHLFVINPRSFRTQSGLKRIQTDLENCFGGGRAVDYKIYISRYPRDAVAAVHRYVSGVSPDEAVRVYAIGGDGILFDCLNGMADFSNAEITSVPYGNANDFVRAFGEDACHDFRDIKKLSEAPARLVDIMHCGSNYAINHLGIGLEAQATLNAQTIFRRSRSGWIAPFVRHTYTLCGFGSLMNAEVMNQKYQVLLDGEDMSGCYFNIKIANGPCNGGAMVSSPYAKPDDGLLDVIFSVSCPLSAVMKSIGDYTKGHFEKHKMYFRRQCKKISLRSDVPIRVHMDGEAFFTEVLSIEIMPRRVKFFAPEGSDFADYSHRAYKGPGRDTAHVSGNTRPLSR